MLRRVKPGPGPPARPIISGPDSAPLATNPRASVEVPSTSHRHPRHVPVPWPRSPSRRGTGQVKRRVRTPARSLHEPARRPDRSPAALGVDHAPTRLSTTRSPEPRTSRPQKTAHPRPPYLLPSGDGPRSPDPLATHDSPLRSDRLFPTRCARGRAPPLHARIVLHPARR